jgi:TonB family protein
MGGSLRKWPGLALACAVLGAQADLTVAATQPVSYLRAQTPLGINPKTRCPELRIADEGTIAVIVFWVPSSGIPSKITLKSSSGSDALDSSALDCVSRLKFAPATRVGDGEPIDSWQQIAFRWAEKGQVPGPAAPIPANARREDSARQGESVTVHVCVDEQGRLEGEPTIVHSSGVSSLDQAALKIASSGSPYYRPENSPNAAPMSGCAQLAIRFEGK